MYSESSPSASAASATAPVEPPVADVIRPAKLVPRWAIHRRLYDWVLSLAHHRHSTTALFILAFAESSVFLVPPDVLQIALTLERRTRAWWYATVSLIGSVLGGMFGYLIGWGFWELTRDFFFRYIFSEQVFNHVQELYRQYDFWAVFVAGFTPIPYKVFTIAAGVFQISFVMLVFASIIGRGGRFYLVAALLYIFGPPIRRFIDRYFNLMCVLFTILLIGGFVLIKMMASH